MNHWFNVDEVLPPCNRKVLIKTNISYGIEMEASLVYDHWETDFCKNSGSPITVISCKHVVQWSPLVNS